MPQRLQRQRVPGYRVPPDAVYVGRGPGNYGRWGNPHKVTKGGLTAEQAVDLYRELLASSPGLRAVAREQLAGKDLLCWCRPGAACHGDLLLEAANETPSTTDYEQGTLIP